MHIGYSANTRRTGVSHELAEGEPAGDQRLTLSCFRTTTTNARIRRRSFAPLHPHVEPGAAQR
jgi:hypothetical protein